MMNNIGHLFDLGYLWIPFVGGMGVALIAGPLGSLMVWRRLAYFGDTLSHSGLLGVTLALWLQINVSVGVCLIALFVALLLYKFQSRAQLAGDTLLGMLSHTTLALGLITLAIREEIRVDVLGFLYGDILAITLQDVFLVYSGAIFIFIVLFFLWQFLLRITIHKELAQVEGVKIQYLEACYLVLLAITVAIAMKIVGVLLITALLIIPAAGARGFAKSPEAMALIASLIGVLSVGGGMFLSHCWDIPTGPSIVLISTGFFIISRICQK